MSESRTVLVTGATGQVGGALAAALLEKGHEIRALTRRPESEPARALEARGAELVQGDFEDQASLERAAEGVDTVFAMSTPFEAGVDAEIREGKAIVDAAASARVDHLVYSSVGSADQDTGIPHFDSKREVERHIVRLDLRYTVLRPVYFMDNVFAPFVLPGLQQGKLALALPASKGLQQVAVADIGAFAALVVEDPERFAGKEIEIAGDEVTGEQAAAIIARASGRSIEYEQVPIDAVRSQSEDMATMLEWFDRVGYSVDIEALRRDYPEAGWKRYAEWAEAQDWSVLS